MASLRDLADLAELAGALAVVVSLVYVGVQIRQNTRALRSSTYQAGTDSVASFMSLLVVHPDVAGILLRGAAGASDLAPEDRYRFETLLRLLFQLLDNICFQHRQGTIDREGWERAAATARLFLAGPGVAAWWQSNQVPLSRDFSAFVNAQITPAMSH